MLLLRILLLLKFVETEIQENMCSTYCSNEKNSEIFIAFKTASVDICNKDSESSIENVLDQKSSILDAKCTKERIQQYLKCICTHEYFEQFLINAVYCISQEKYFEKKTCEYKRKNNAGNTLEEDIQNCKTFHFEIEDEDKHIYEYLILNNQFLDLNEEILQNNFKIIKKIVCQTAKDYLLIKSKDSSTSLTIFEDFEHEKYEYSHVSTIGHQLKCLKKDLMYSMEESKQNTILEDTCPDINSVNFNIDEEIKKLQLTGNFGIHKYKMDKPMEDYIQIAQHVSDEINNNANSDLNKDPEKNNRENTGNVHSDERDKLSVTEELSEVKTGNADQSHTNTESLIKTSQELTNLEHLNIQDINVETTGLIDQQKLKKDSQSNINSIVLAVVLIIIIVGVIGFGSWFYIKNKS